MPNPFVSVLIDTYNHERFIEEAVHSVLSQDFPAGDREIVVVDDGSTDKTPQLLGKFEPHIRILRKENGGQASAFNHGIPQCRGEIVAFLDGDDWWAPNKLTAVVNAFNTEPAVGLVGHSITEVLSDGMQRSELVRDSPRFRIDSVAGARLFRMRKSFLGTSRMAYRADLLRRIGPVPKELAIQADEFLFTLGALFSEVLLLREPLTFYRLQGQNLFQLSNNNVPSLRRKYEALAALSESLSRRFAEEGVPREVSTVVIESVESEADSLRTHLGEGTRLSTIRAELRAYGISHENASAFRWFLKCLSLIPALLLSPKQFTAWKRQLASNSLYRRTRQKFLPPPAPAHVDRTGNWGSR